jgi:hypothetical protein
MVTADESTWNKLFEVFAQESDANEKLKLMNGLANIRIPSLLIKYLFSSTCGFVSAHVLSFQIDRISQR